MTLARPEVSVVMSVFNGGPRLSATLRSVLDQEDVDLELVVIDDGSTDETGRLLDEAAATAQRVRVFHQENTGLTRALARGCREARADVIARQDAGDLSLPGRLRRQVDRLKARPGETLVSCWATFVGPEDEELYSHTPPDEPEVNRRRLHARAAAEIRSICGAAASFRRGDYERVGGFREAFYVAQDLDLWLRLTDSGTVGVVPEILYHARVTPSSLSARNRAQQLALAAIGLELSRVRESGGDEGPLLARAAGIRRSKTPSRPSRRDLANGLYFIGKCLVSRGDRRGRSYLERALRAYPLHIRAAAALATSGWWPGGPGRRN